jgi:hypothetical protein
VCVYTVFSLFDINKPTLIIMLMHAPVGLGHVYFGWKNLNFIPEMALNNFKWGLNSEMEISSSKNMERLL